MEKITDVLHDVQQEFENEIGDLYYYGEYLSDRERDIALFIIDCYKNKVELLLKEREEDK